MSAIVVKKMSNYGLNFHNIKTITTNFIQTYLKNIKENDVLAQKQHAQLIIYDVLLCKFRLHSNGILALKSLFRIRSGFICRTLFTYHELILYINLDWCSKICNFYPSSILKKILNFPHNFSICLNMMKKFDNLKAAE